MLNKSLEDPKDFLRRKRVTTISPMVTRCHFDLVLQLLQLEHAAKFKQESVNSKFWKQTSVTGGEGKIDHLKA